MGVFAHNGNNIYYEINGDIASDKKIILILNGIMMNVRSWDPFIQTFTKNNTVIRLDMYDQGLSHKMSNTYTQDLQVDLINDLIEYLNVSKVNIIGISYGASIALQFAVKYPDRLDSLVVANGVAKTSDWLKAIGEGWNRVGKTRDGLAYYNISIPYIYSPTFYQHNLDWMEQRKKLLIPIFSNEVFLDAMERLTISSYTHDVVKSLESINHRSLIIASSEDYLTPVFEQKLMNAKMPNSKLVIIPDCGHASMYEQPELFTTLTLGFINNNQSKVII